MNDKRRAMLRNAIGKLSEVRDGIDSVREDEDEARDNMPENLQGTERFEESETSSDAMDSAVGYIDEAISALEEVV